MTNTFIVGDLLTWQDPKNITSGLTVASRPDLEQFIKLNGPGPFQILSIMPDQLLDVTLKPYPKVSKEDTAVNTNWPHYWFRLYEEKKETSALDQFVDLLQSPLSSGSKRMKRKLAGTPEVYRVPGKSPNMFELIGDHIRFFGKWDLDKAKTHTKEHIVSLETALSKSKKTLQILEEVEE